MTTDSTCPDSLCKFRNPLGYCTRTGGCIVANKTTETPEEVTPVEEAVTPDIIRKEFMGLVNDIRIWNIPEGERGLELKTRSLYYIRGAHDMAVGLIHRLGDTVTWEGKKDGNEQMDKRNG